MKVKKHSALSHTDFKMPMESSRNPLINLKFKSKARLEIDNLVSKSKQLLRLFRDSRK